MNCVCAISVFQNHVKYELLNNPRIFFIRHNNGEQREEGSRGERGGGACARSDWLRHHFGIRSAISHGGGRVLRVVPRVTLINEN